MNEFPNQTLKKISNDFDKISLLFQTVLKPEGTSLLPTDQYITSPQYTAVNLVWNCDWSKANYLSPTVKLDFSWTLEMSDQ